MRLRKRTTFISDLAVTRHVQVTGGRHGIETRITVDPLQRGMPSMQGKRATEQHELRWLLLAGIFVLLILAGVLVTLDRPWGRPVSLSQVRTLTGLDFPPSARLMASCYRDLWQGFLLAKVAMAPGEFNEFRRRGLSDAQWLSADVESPRGTDISTLPYSVGEAAGWWTPHRAIQIIHTTVPMRAAYGSQRKKPFSEGAMMELIAVLDDPNCTEVYIAVY